MQIITIHTWKCGACEYVQDFEPTKENMLKHFRKPLENKCPACDMDGKENALPKVTDNAQKTKMRIAEAGDKEAAKAAIIAAGKNQISTGVKEIRMETEEEKLERIDKEVEEGFLTTKAAKTKLKNARAAEPAITREFYVFREETDDELEARATFKTKNIKEATPEQIAEIKAQYEDA